MPIVAVERRTEATYRWSAGDVVAMAQAVVTTDSDTTEGAAPGASVEVAFPMRVEVTNVTDMSVTFQISFGDRLTIEDTTLVVDEDLERTLEPFERRSMVILVRQESD